MKQTFKVFIAVFLCSCLAPVLQAAQARQMQRIVEVVKALPKGGIANQQPPAPKQVVPKMVVPTRPASPQPSVVIPKSMPKQAKILQAKSAAKAVAPVDVQDRCMICNELIRDLILGLNSEVAPPNIYQTVCCGGKQFICEQDKNKLIEYSALGEDISCPLCRTTPFRLRLFRERRAQGEILEVQRSEQDEARLAEAIAREEAASEARLFAHIAREIFELMFEERSNADLDRMDDNEQVQVVDMTRFNNDMNFRQFVLDIGTIYFHGMRVEDITARQMQMLEQFFDEINLLILANRE